MKSVSQENMESTIATETRKGVTDAVASLHTELQGHIQNLIASYDARLAEKNQIIETQNEQIEVLKNQLAQQKQDIDHLTAHQTQVQMFSVIV